MGMTIEQAIEHGTKQLEIFGGEHKEFIECAINTMRKYQKIQEIVRETHEGCITKYQKIDEVTHAGTNI